VVYALLSGAKCNLGDFLILERAIALLRALRPDRRLQVLPGWEPLDPKSEVVRSARAILIPGGPGFQPNLFPDVYPLMPRLEDIPCPVVPIGVGWKGRNGSAAAVAGYRFSEHSLEALRWMSERTPALGCRDPLTQQVLERNGFANTTMVGCPVWYDLGATGRSPALDAPIEKIVFTPAQSPLLQAQSVAVAERIAALWPRAEKSCSFHRGFARAGAWIPEADIANSRRIAEATTKLGFRPIDVTGDVEKIRFYAECSLHVGYRVHAHLDFCSRRQRSLLIEEDGRGAGASLGLGLAGIPAYLEPPGLDRYLPTRLRRGARPDPQAPERVESRLRDDVETRFARYADLGTTLDRTFETMRAFLRALP
jgi:hypothetical protein